MPTSPSPSRHRSTLGRRRRLRRRQRGLPVDSGDDFHPVPPSSLLRIERERSSRPLVDSSHQCFEALRNGARFLPAPSLLRPAFPRTPAWLRARTQSVVRRHRRLLQLPRTPSLSFGKRRRIASGRKIRPLSRRSFRRPVGRSPRRGRRSADGRPESVAGTGQDDVHERSFALRRGESGRILPPDSCRTSAMNDATGASPVREAGRETVRRLP